MNHKSLFIIKPSLVLLIVFFFYNVSSQSITWDKNINLSENLSQVGGPEYAGDVIVDLVSYNNKIYVYSTKKIIVLNTSNQVLAQIDLPGYFGKFNPVFYYHRGGGVESNLMAINEADGWLYFVAPNLNIYRVSLSNDSITKCFNRPGKIEHFQSLTSYCVLKYDPVKQRIYWLVEGRNEHVNQPGNFHTRDTYIGLLEVSANGESMSVYREELINVYFDDYFQTAFDIEYNELNDLFYVARKKKIQIYPLNK